MSSRKIHFSRLLDLVTGSAFGGAKTKIQKSAIYRDFNLAKLNDTRFRDVITANLPVFYVVDLDLIAKEIVNSLVSDPKRFISKRYTSDGPVEFGEAGFSVKDISNSESDLVQSLLKELKQLGISTLKSTLPSKSFTVLYSKIEAQYNVLINKLAQSGQSYNKYRNSVINFGYNQRKEMSSYGSFIASDGEAIVNLKPGQILVISPTFDQAVRKVNETLLPPIEKLLETKYNIVVSKNNTGFKIGNLVNAGHTAAVTSNGSIIGVNMPSAQELQFRLSGSPKSFEIERELGNLYYEIGYSVEFKQEFNAVGKSLVDMQFAFVISQPAALNTNKLRVDEQRRLKRLIDKEVIPTIEAQIKNKMFSGIINPEDVSASPTLVEYMVDALVNSLKGVSNPKLIKKSKAKESTNLKVPVVLNNSSGKKAQVRRRVAGINGLKIKVSPSTVPQLSSLLALINANLVNRIKDNMGTGNRTDILNLRTGRLAESAQVNRLSESRQGLITAFYSYMKNPYATFSDGGMRQYPKSRDPKLLISKSIREIAAENAVTRLRSVLV